MNADSEAVELAGVLLCALGAIAVVITLYVVVMESLVWLFEQVHPGAAYAAAILIGAFLIVVGAALWKMSGDRA